MYTLWFVAATFLSQTPNDAKAHLDKLQGEWTLESLEVNGSNVDLANIQGTVLTVKGDNYTVKIKDFVLPATVTLDPAKDPFEIDLTFLDGVNKDRTQKGIYRFQGNTFQVVRGLAPEQNRPRDYGTWPNTGYLMSTWKRK